MKNILILHTGGTISMKQDDSAGILSSETNPLFHQSLNIKNVSMVQEELFNIPSEHMTPSWMLKIAKRIEAARDKYDGVVITHGTDTLEETAYFLDLTLDLDCPVVVTGAMRSADHFSPDGPANLKAAVLTAADDHAWNQGVLVVLNNQIFAARFVTKTHTTNLATFQAPQNGPLGSIIGEHVSFLTQVTKQDSNMIDHTTSGLYLFKAFAGMNGELLKLIDQPTTNGAVIEGFGAGNLPQAVVPTIQQLITHHIPVVVVSRSFNGSVAPIYGYEGGAKQLQEIGVILCQNLNGQKALIRMQVGLSAGLHDKALITYLRNQEK